MDTRSEQFSELLALLNELREQTISPQRFKRLEKIIINDPSARDIYIDYFKVCGLMHSFQLAKHGSLVQASDIPMDIETKDVLLQLLSCNEDTAPVEVLDEPQLDITTIEVEKPKHSPSKPSKFFRTYNAIVSVAAVLLLFFIVYANMFPTQYCKPVATLTEQVEAKWNKDSETIYQHSRLATNTAPYILDSGIVKFVYDTGVDVLVEGPAEFQIEREGVFLKYGKLYSKVSAKGQGFTVYCAKSKFIDLGTEFGIVADLSGSSQLHVLDGKVQMYAGLADSNKEIKMVNKGQAFAFNSNTSDLESIDFDGNAFVQQIDTNSKLIWRGQKSIDLADIVGGGNGFGTGRIEYGVLATNGKFVDKYHDFHSIDKNIGYQKVAQSKFIDGVFIPDGGNGPVTISSKGDLFNNCVDTNNDFWGCVQNGAIHSHKGNIVKHSLTLDGVNYGIAQNPAIFMHANQGVTFDLNEIRKSIPGFKLKSFTTTCGVSDSVFDQSVFENNTPLKRNAADLPECVFYILIDGKQVNSDLPVSSGDKLNKVEYEITDSDEFLTLIASVNGSSAFTWSLFARPELNFEIENK